ncbi:MAG: NACHT domain-containing protein [Chloroflexi bacterium]|nr:NACHT domain-containing protein [Chloroflexota bacterium]
MSHHSTRVESPERLRLFFLGTFRIECDGQAICLSTHKAESLLAYLVLHPEQHPREKLAALFWGDVPDEQARLSLRVALATLRKESNKNLLLADREMIQLNPDHPIWLDVWEFQESAKDNPESAIELYRGDLLPDLYDDWVALERERLRLIYLDALLRTVQRARSESKYVRAIDLARRVLATDHANEKAYQHLIFCHLALGNRTDALKQYAECQRALRDELNVEPSPETTALYVRAQTEATGTKSSEALFANLPTPLTSFVGRVDEIAQVKHALATTRLLTLIGAGGCGKTRLAIQVATELAATERFKQGVWWVDLAALSDSTLVTQTVAMVFNLSESPTMPLIAVLTNFLRAKESLIVLDNGEHLRGACGQLAGTLLSACPKLHILVTSREPLSISGEVAWRVPSLSLPDVTQFTPLAQLSTTLSFN